MESLLAKLDPRTMMLLMVSAAVLVATALATYVVWPEAKKYQHSNHTLAVLAEVVTAGSALEQKLAAYQGEVEALNRQLHGDMVNLPENQVESFIIGRLQAISWRNNIELLSVTPGKGSNVQVFEEMLFNVEISGDYFNLFAWLQELDSELGFVVVKDFSIRSGNSNDTERLTTHLTIVSYREVADA